MAGHDLSKRIVYHVDGMRNVRVKRDVYKRDAGAELAINVYAPASLSGGARLPAVVFVHGGPIPADFQPPTQWGVFVSYGELAAASGLVGVTFNHRLFAMEDFDRAQADVTAAIDDEAAVSLEHPRHEVRREALSRPTAVEAQTGWPDHRALVLAYN